MGPTPLSWKHYVAGMLGALLVVSFWLEVRDHRYAQERVELGELIPQGAPPLSQEQLAAWSLLAHTQRFQDGWSCYSDEPPVQYPAWFALLNSPHAEFLFDQLCKKGKGAGLLYGVAGLAKLESPLYSKALEQARKDDRYLGLSFGWVSCDTTVARALTRTRSDLDNIFEDLRLPEDWEDELASSITLSMQT